MSCRRRESNQAAQIQLLNHLYRDNPDFRQLESLLVQDPELCVTLLRQVNSAAYHRPHPVSSIRRAITTLGLQRLKRLILTLLLARNGPASLLMLPQLLTRAAMCERLALHFGTAPPDEAFTVGTFSLIHTLLGRPVTPCSTAWRWMPASSTRSAPARWSWAVCCAWCRPTKAPVWTRLPKS